MGKAGKKSNTPPKTDGNAPLPITHEKTIGIQQPQSISLGASISISRLLVRGGDLLQAIVTRLPRGRPREYDVEGIVRVAEDLIRDTDVDDNLDPFCVRVRRECKNKRPPHQDAQITQPDERNPPAVL